MTCIQIGLAATGAYAHSTPEPGFATAKTNVERMNITNSKVNNAEAPYRRVTFQARTAKFNNIYLLPLTRLTNFPYSVAIMIGWPSVPWPPTSGIVPT